MNFKEIATKRYAVKEFTGEEISEQKIDELKELIRLSASSFGLQPYNILIIKSKELKEKLQPLAYNQPQITTSSHLLVFCSNTKVKERIDDYVEMLGGEESLNESTKNYIGMMRSLESLDEESINMWSTKQTYIALGNALNGAKSLGFDSCPMEGFDANGFKEALELPEHITPVVLCPVGIAADTPKPKIRYPAEVLFIEK